MTTPSGQTCFLRRTPAGDGHTRAAEGFARAAGNHERAGDDGWGHADAGNGRRASAAGGLPWRPGVLPPVRQVVLELTP
jgi:hypothetical protein